MTTIDAHILKTDGAVGAIIHIDPDDDPIAGQPTNMFWDFKNTKGTFSIDECSCFVTIIENGNQIQKSELIQSTFTFTFPQKDVYQIKVSGSPKTPNEFPPFILSYDIRVSRESIVAPSPTVINNFDHAFETIWIDFAKEFGVFFVFVVGSLIAIVIYLKKEK